MSVQKVQILHTQSRKIIRNQKDAIKKIKEELFLLGKNYENFLFSEFRKNFRSLIFSLDLEKYTTELSEALLEAENLLSEKESHSTTHEKKELVSFIRKSLLEQQQVLETFKEAILALREAPQAKLAGKTNSDQMQLFKNYICATLQEKKQGLSFLGRGIADRAKDRLFNIKSIVHLGILSPYNNHPTEINPLIQIILNGFVANKYSRYDQIAKHAQRYSISPTGLLRCINNGEIQMNTETTTTESSSARSSSTTIRFSL